jgi:catechol 2,3-dioxygenase-like lactoylglutathione lyase family enzyme
VPRDVMMKRQNDTKTPLLGSCDVIVFAATAAPDRAKEFYQNALGLHFVADEAYALVFEANGTMLRLQKVQQVAKASYTVLGWKVADIVAAVLELRAKGVRFERFQGMPQDDLGIWTAPSGARIAWFKDPDGNILSITEFTRADR